MTRQVKISQRDIQRFEEFLDLLLIEGDLNVTLSYGLTSIADVRRELKVDAVEDAERMAHLLAHELGAVLGEPIIISEYPIIAEYEQVDRLSKQSGFIMRSVPETIHVREKVWVRFRLDARDCYTVHR